MVPQVHGRFFQIVLAFSQFLNFKQTINKVNQNLKHFFSNDSVV